MRLALPFIGLIMLQGCTSTSVCRADEDCADLEYCYRAPLDLEQAEGTEPGYPYEETGLCTSDCTSDADCFGSSRCTPKGICKDLTSSNQRQWSGYEPNLPNFMAQTRFAPLFSCQDFVTCLLNCETPETCSQCSHQVDGPSRELSGLLSACLQTNCPQTRTVSQCLNDECNNEFLLCVEDI